MDTFPDIPFARRYVYIAIMFGLNLQISSTGDSCPPQEKLDPCICYKDREMKVRLPTTPSTTSVPMTVTSSRPAVEDNILVQHEGRQSLMNEGLTSSPELEKVPQKRSTDDASLLNLPSSLPNTTCCTVVVCNAPKSLFILEDAIANGLSRKWVDKMIVANLPPEKGRTLVHLPGTWLKMLRVKHFEIAHTLLYGDFIHYGNPFEGQEQSMLWFGARNCYLSGSLSYETVGTVNTKGLNRLPRIEVLDFSRNHLVYVFNTGFRYPPTNLSTVILSHNSIQGIESSTFHHTPFLKRLDLSHNLLEQISRNIFASPARNLQSIDLSWNQLKVLPVDFFVNMPKLNAVNLSKNFLTSLPSQPWSLVWRQLQFIDISSNFIQCDCSLMWILPLLSPPVPKVSTTPPPQPLAGQSVLGSCSYIRLNSSSQIHRLTSLTRSSLNC